MIGKAFICIAAAAQVAELSQKGKYLLIEGKTKENLMKDQGNGGVSGEGEYVNEYMDLRDEYGDEKDYSKTSITEGNCRR